MVVARLRDSLTCLNVKTKGCYLAGRKSNGGRREGKEKSGSRISNWAWPGGKLIFLSYFSAAESLDPYGLPMDMSAELEQGCSGLDSGVSPGETLNHRDPFGHRTRSQMRIERLRLLANA